LRTWISQKLGIKANSRPLHPKFKLALHDVQLKDDQGNRLFNE